MTISNNHLSLLPLFKAANTSGAVSKFPVNVGAALSSCCQENLTKGSTRWKYYDNVFWFIDNAAEDRQRV